MVHLDTQIDITPGSSGVWTEKDLTPYLSGNTAKIVLLRIANSNGSINYYAGSRAKGSAGSTTCRVNNSDGGVNQYVAVSSDGKIDVISEFVTNCRIYFVAYFTDIEAVSWIEPKDKTLGALSAWTNIDLTADASTEIKFAVFNCKSISPSGGAVTFGLRPDGSTDAFINSTFCSGVIMPVSDNFIVEAYMSIVTSIILELVGYIIIGEKKINGLDVSPTSPGNFINVDLSSDTPPIGNAGACIFFTGAGAYDYRKDGVAPTFDLYKYNGFSKSYPIALTSDIFEVKVSAPTVDLYCYGYFGLTTQYAAETISTPVVIADSRLEDTGAVLSASSTAAGYSVQNLIDGRSYTKWKAANTNTPCYITFDTGSAKSIDSLGILAHNLGTIGAVVQLQASNDNFVMDFVGWPEIDPSDDIMIMQCLATAARRYGRLRITGTLSAPPEIAVLKAGVRVTFPYPPDPGNYIDEGSEEEDSVSNEGMDLGTTVFYHDNKVEPEFSNLLRTWVMATYKTFWDLYGKKRKRFFFAPDLVNFPTIIHWAKFKKGSRFKMPLTTSVYVDKLKLDMESTTEE